MTTLNRTRTGKTLVRIAFLAMMAGGASSASAEEPSKPFELQQHRAEIREALLKDTPLGASEKEVLAAIAKRLVGETDKLPPIEDYPAVGPSTEGSRLRGVRSVRLFLGQYYDHPELVFLSAPMLSQKEVSAQWAFDEHGRLIEIFVDKLNSVY